MSIFDVTTFNNKYLNTIGLNERTIEIVDDYFTKLMKILMTGKNMLEIETVLIIGQAIGCFKDRRDWDELVYIYLKKLNNEHIFKHNIDLSYSNGLTFISSILHFYSKQTGFYRNFLNGFDEYILHCIEKRIEILLNSDGKIHTRDFDAISGMAGIVQYLFLLDNQDTISLLNMIADYLTSITQCKYYKGKIIPGWYVPADDHLTRLSRDNYPEGHINYGLAHGITGVLASLIKLGQNGINECKVNEAINSILIEMDKVKYTSDNGIVYYPGMLEVNKYINEQYHDNKNYRMSWCYGSISMLYILYRAYQYLGNNQMCDQVLREIELIASAGEKYWYLESPIICHGYAGTAHIFKKVYDITKSSKIQAALTVLINNILNVYNSNYLYGFRDVHYRFSKDKEYKIYEDKNTFLEGATGIISVLLEFLTNEEFTSYLLLLE